jgi:uncharacterized protein (TIGR02246 family)
MKSCAVLFLLGLVAAPAFGTPTDDALAHSKAFERAVNARDAQAVLALYVSDAHVVWPGQGEEANSKAAIEQLVSEFIKQLPKDAKITLKSQTAIPLGGGYIATVGHWTESFTDASGKVQSADIRTTEILKKQKGKTLYVVDHASIGLPPEPATPPQPGT